MENQVNLNNQFQGENLVNQDITEKPKINYWMVSTMVFFVLFVLAIGAYIFRSASCQKNLGTSSQESQVAYIPTPNPKDGNSKDLEKYSIPYYSGGYKLYTVTDPKTFNTSVFAESREVNPKVIKMLELESFQGETDSVVWPHNTTDISKQRFILKTIGPGDTVSDYLLSVDGSPAIILNFPYTFYRFFQVLTWIDQERILVMQTDLSETTDEIITTYWIAPVTDLSQKKIVNF